ncbi:protein-export chaperone SecB [Stakelama sp. CBK3Z-3]|uniref:Protein-export protein SecB n=1 Tax=Stakelama flava TaxID=2860338 RepID=A0ABS6XPY9_9SPHN|nr:protein-export chaperone SecB [Stakelama flava]MBW4332282.1 protein-export chaperone SecB [Stakelama flava]
MADQDEFVTTGEAAANGADTGPMANLISQYVKDLSFENPNSPQVYQRDTPPQIDVQFNIGVNQVGEEVHEVVLKIESRAEHDGQVAFLVDLTYAGLFQLRNLPQEHVQPFLLGEAPRILFPFARRVLADAVRDGSFAPLLLDPIDFNAMYQQQLQQHQAEAQGDTPVGHA